MKKKVNKKKIILLLIAIIGIVFIILFLSKNLKIGKKSELLNFHFESRVKTLEDFDTKGIVKYGWLQVQGTNIDLPIISSLSIEDLDFSYGWLNVNSIGYKTRKVLVGHNVLNVSSSPMVNNSLLTDFEDLMAFVYYDFAKENMYLSYTEYGVDKVFVIYAIGFYDYGYDNAEGLNTEEEIKKYIKESKQNSIYQYNVDVNENDNLLTVKTCTRYFGVDEKQQFVIDARELRNDEKLIKNNVKKTSLYKKYNLKDSYSKNISL